MRSRGLELLALGLLGACSSPGPADEPDAGLAPSFELVLGTGREAFEALDAEGTLELERGSQGLQHVFVSVRAPVAEGLHLVDVVVAGDDRALSAPTRVNAPFVEVAGRDVAELVGLLVVVPEPDGYTDGRRARLRVVVEPRSGGLGAAEREVQLRW